MARLLFGVVAAVGIVVAAHLLWSGPASVCAVQTGAAAVMPVHPFKGPNVLLITIDTVRADHMSLYGYNRPTTPRIDRFAAGARVFDRAYATSPLTSPSIVSILSGYYPYTHRIRLLWQKVDPKTVTIADRLRQMGYETAAVVSNIVLSDKAIGLGDRFDHYDDAVDEPEPHRPAMLERKASRTTDAAIQWIEQRSSNRPFFLWVHYIDPHGPYRPPAGTPVTFRHDEPVTVDPKRIPGYVREPGVTDGLDYVDRYDEEVAYTDQEVGRFLENCKTLGILDTALVIITADHGEQMVEGDFLYFCHGYDVDEAVIHVPLIVKHPSVPAGRCNQPVSIADVTPTILAVVGLPTPEGIDGRSLRGDISSRPPYAEGRDSAGSGGLRRAYIYAHRKVVVVHGKSNVPRMAWAYDVANDPTESNRLPVDDAEPAYQVLAELIRNERDPGGVPAGYANGDRPMQLVPDSLDDDTTDALRSLGYVQ